MADIGESCCYSIERWVVRILLIVFLGGSGLVAQHARDSWKVKSFAATPYSLANLPLTSSERQQIYGVVDAATSRYSVPNPRGDKQREVVMSTRVGLIELARNARVQILARGPNPFCGATGNCPIWIFDRQGGQLRPLLEALAAGVIVLETSSKGFHDIAVVQNYSAFDEQYRDFRWNGSEYKQIDCYETKYPRPDEPGGSDRAPRPLIAECP
jgi:hypothetical protein